MIGVSDKSNLSQLIEILESLFLYVENNDEKKKLGMDFQTFNDSLSTNKKVVMHGFDLDDSFDENPIYNAVLNALETSNFSHREADFNDGFFSTLVKDLPFPWERKGIVFQANEINKLSKLEFERFINTILIEYKKETEEFDNVNKAEENVTSPATEESTSALQTAEPDGVAPIPPTLNDVTERLGPQTLYFNADLDIVPVNPDIPEYPSIEAEEQVVEEQVAEESVAEESVAEESVAEESVAEESVAEESVAEESVAEESVVEESVAAEQPDEEQPAAVPPLPARQPAAAAPPPTPPRQDAVPPAAAEPPPPPPRRDTVQPATAARTDEVDSLLQEQPNFTPQRQANHPGTALSAGTGQLENLKAKINADTNKQKYQIERVVQNQNGGLLLYMTEGHGQIGVKPATTNAENLVYFIKKNDPQPNVDAKIRTIAKLMLDTCPAAGEIKINDSAHKDKMEAAIRAEIESRKQTDPTFTAPLIRSKSGHILINNEQNPRASARAH